MFYKFYKYYTNINKKNNFLKQILKNSQKSFLKVLINYKFLKKNIK